MKINMFTINNKYNTQNFTARKVPVLSDAVMSKAEETALGKIIRAGATRIELNVSKKSIEKKVVETLSEPKIEDLEDDGTGILPKNEEDEFEENVRYILTQDAQNAVSRLVESHQKLVQACANIFSERGVQFQDLVQEGNIGLIKAAQRFDPQKARFSTYAHWWIVDSISRCIKKTRDTIRLPMHLIDKAFEVGYAEFTLATRLGRRPSREELATEVGLKVEKLDKLKAHAARTLNAPESLDAPVYGDGNLLSETIPGEYGLNPYEYCEKVDLESLVRNVVDSLPKNRREIVNDRFGLNGNDESTLNEIAARRGCKHQNIDGILGRTFNSLDPDDLYEFKIFLTA